MSEHPELNGDPLAEKLGRFTPDTTGFDRDALLFQSGRASVRPNRFWPALAGMLLLTQAATLSYFLTRLPQSTVPIVVVAPHAEPSKIEENAVRSSASEEPREWSYHRPAMTGNIDDLPKVPAFEYATVPDRVLTVRSLSSVLGVN